MTNQDHHHPFINCVTLFLSLSRYLCVLFDNQNISAVFIFITFFFNLCFFPLKTSKKSQVKTEKIVHIFPHHHHLLTFFALLVYHYHRFFDENANQIRSKIIIINDYIYRWSWSWSSSVVFQEIIIIIVVVVFSLFSDFSRFL